MLPWIRPDELASRLDDPRLRIVDVRFSLADRDAGRRAFAEGHLPGAVYLDLEDDLSGPVGPHGGRHPLPDPERLAATLARAGIGDGDHVVAYDDAANMIAGRLWWLLRWLGHDAVQVLDGGVAAWRASGGAWTAGVARPAPARFVARPREGLTVDRAWLQAHARDPRVVVVDVRAPERYRGEHEPIDPVGGHVPGAVNRPFTGHLADGRFLPPTSLAAMYGDLAEADTVVVYCGSGVSAAHGLMALEAAGVRGAKLYPGSWSDWVSHAGAEVATGSRP